MIEAEFLIAPYIAESVVVEDESDKVDLLLHRGSQFLQSEEKTAVAAGAKNGLIGIRDLHAESGGKAVAQGARESFGDVRARFIDRKSVPGGEANLIYFANEEAIPRQDAADHFQVAHHRLNLLNRVSRECFGIGDKSALASRLRS